MTNTAMAGCVADQIARGMTGQRDELAKYRLSVPQQSVVDRDQVTEIRYYGNGPIKIVAETLETVVLVSGQTDGTADLGRPEKSPDGRRNRWYC